MTTAEISLILSAAALLIAVLALFLRPKRQVTDTGSREQRFDSVPMQLQAYERLVLLTERIALPNLISRLNQPGISAMDMKMILVEHIKQEFEYNSTQQLYISNVAWDAVRNLKEQNILMVNQVAGTLPASATAAELNKKILEVIIAQPGGAMHEQVARALNFEAQKLMKQ